MAKSDEFSRQVMAVGPDGTNEGQPTSLPTLRVILPEWGVRQSYVVESPADVGAAMQHAMEPWLGSMDQADHGSSGRTNVRLQLLEHRELSGEAVWVMDEGVRLLFDDASFVALNDFGNSRSVDPLNDEPDPVDVGVALLKPITQHEYGHVERLLAVLWHEAGDGTLTDAQERQVLAIAAMIEAQHRDAEPGVTPRWKVVGTIGGGLRYLAKELPKDALVWWKVFDLLSEAGWIDTMHSLLP